MASTIASSTSSSRAAWRIRTRSARVAQEARERDQAMLQQHELERRNLEFGRRRRRIEAQIEELQAQLADDGLELKGFAEEATARDQQTDDDRARMSASRMVAPRRAKT